MALIDIISATNPRRYKNETETITLDVQFSHLPAPVAFSARKDDSEEHGQALYARATLGEYGAIKELEPPQPTEAQQQSRIYEALTHAATAMAPLEDAEKLGIISETEKAQLIAWQQYRVSLHRLPKSEGWPTNVIFPDPPHL